MKSRKVLSIVLAVVLIFTSVMVSTALVSPSTEQSSMEQFHSISADPRVIDIKDTDTVKIIVELKDEPIIDYATRNGSKVEDIDASTLNKLTSKLKSAQANVKKKINSKGVKAQYKNDFVTVFNGFSLETTLADAKKIESLTEVKMVHLDNEYSLPEPDMTSSNEMVEAPQVWELGYKGEGTVISVIDSGVDYTHKDFVLTSPAKAALKKGYVEAIIKKYGLSGKWYTDKVPYAYNYYDNNDEVIDDLPGTSMHGMHVAGTAGANGTIKGVAPEAQILGMRVFSNNPAEPATTSGSIYLAAIEDSIKLGADVINMSLGSTAGFQDSLSPEIVAIDKAVNNGIVVSVSAGNSGHITYGYTVTQGGRTYNVYPFAKNPDIGVVGSPSLNINTFSVASLENSKMTVTVLNSGVGKINYLKAGGGPDPEDVLTGQVPVVFCNFGLIGTTTAGEYKNDFAGVDVKGKIALIERGGYIGIAGNFVDKIANAQNAGAVGVIVYNHTVGGEAFVPMAYPTNGTIPAVFVGNIGGMALRNASDDLRKAEFTGETTLIVNPSAGIMAASTSWGVTPNLDFKPEITAPGANIYSTLNNNKYGVKSGTSMAAPHVAGGSALLLQRVDKELNLKGYNRSIAAKNLIMSTAIPLPEQYELGLVSPRRQGAGVMNLNAAMTTPAIVTDKNTGISKVALKEIGDVATFTAKVTNFSNKAVEYSLDYYVGTDYVYNGQNYTYNQGLEGADVQFKHKGKVVDKITVPKNNSVELQVTVDVTNAVDLETGKKLAEVFENGYFVDGFIRLTSVNDDIPEIGLPFVGFNGDWNKPPIIDDTNYNPAAKKTLGINAHTVMAWLDGGTYRFLGHPFEGAPKEEYISFSPNGDGKADHARPLLSFLRNARELEINILDKDGKVLRNITLDEYIRKCYYNGGSNPVTYRTYSNWIWDGKIDDNIAQEGQYIYQIKARIDYEGADWQIVEFPIWVDNSAPTINETQYNQETKMLTVSAQDNHMIRHYQLIVDGKVVTNATGIFDLSAYEGVTNFTVTATDFALNTTTLSVDLNQ